MSNAEQELLKKLGIKGEIPEWECPDCAKSLVRKGLATWKKRPAKNYPKRPKPRRVRIRVLVAIR